MKPFTILVTSLHAKLNFQVGRKIATNQTFPQCTPEMFFKTEWNTFFLLHPYLKFIKLILQTDRKGMAFKIEQP